METTIKDYRKQVRKVRRSLMQEKERIKQELEMQELQLRMNDLMEKLAAASLILLSSFPYCWQGVGKLK